MRETQSNKIYRKTDSPRFDCAQSRYCLLPTTVVCKMYIEKSTCSFNILKCYSRSKLHVAHSRIPLKRIENAHVILFAHKHALIENNNSTTTKRHKHTHNDSFPKRQPKHTQSHARNTHILRNIHSYVIYIRVHCTMYTFYF